MSGEQETVSTPLGIPSTAEDLDFWKKNIHDVTARLLEDSGSYTPTEQEKHLAFVTDNVLPTLGKAPARAHAPAFGTPFGFPVEPSINFTDNSNNPVVRMSLEVLGQEAGSDSDIWGWKAATDIIPKLAAATPGCDLRWWNALLPSFIIEQGTEESKRGEEILAPQTKPCPKGAVAFDFDGGAVSMKSYFFVPPKSLASGVSTEDIVFPLLHKISEQGPSLGPALTATEEYLRSIDQKVRVFAVGMDCVDPTKEKARVKVYSRLDSVAFSAVREAMTLGGRVTDETTLKGIEELRSIWHLIMDEPEGITDDNWAKPSLDPESGFSGLAFSIEIAPGDAVPIVKIYITTWLYSRSDQAVFENVEQICKQRGWLKGAEGRARRMAERAIGKECFNTENRGHTYISYAYSKKKGAYMTTYFADPRHGKEVYRAG